MISILNRFAVLCSVFLLPLVPFPMSASHGQESTSSQSSATGITEEEYAIYSSLIKQLYIKPSTKLSVIRERTFKYDSARGTDEQPWKGKVKGVVIEQSATDDFETKNSQHWQVDSALLKLGVKIEISTDADLRAIFHGRTGQVEWFDYYRRYPDADGLITFSRVGFNTAHTQALVYVGSRCGPECGDVHFFLLQQANGNWTIWKVLKKVNFS